MDPQANFSNRYLKMEIDPYQQEGGYRLCILAMILAPLKIVTGMEKKHCRIFFGKWFSLISTYIETLEIAPSHSSKLLLAEAVTREEVVQKVYDQLSKFLELDDVKISYDKIIIDTPPSKGPVTISVVRAATDLLIPSIMEPQPIEGIYGMIHLWKSETLRRPENRPLNLIGVLPNSFDRRGIIHKDHYDSLKQEMPDYVLDRKLADV